MTKSNYRTLRMLPKAKQIIGDIVQNGDITVDATMGNGNDTEFLAQAVGPSGKVYAFDIQKEAVINTKSKLGDLVNRTELIEDCHSNLSKYVPYGITAAMFNLGYLPRHHESSIITNKDTTLPAIESVLQLLKPGGIVTIAVYDGHPGGSDERDAVLSYTQKLDSTQFQVIRYELVNSPNHPPFLLIIEKSHKSTS